MFKAMIQSPMGGGHVEEVILDIPSMMAYFPSVTAGELRKRISTKIIGIKTYLSANIR